MVCAVWVGNVCCKFAVASLKNYWLKSHWIFYWKHKICARTETYRTSLLLNFVVVVENPANIFWIIIVVDFHKIVCHKKMNISVRTTAKISETTNARQFHGRKTKRAVSEMVVVSEQTGGARNTRQQCTAFRWREISHFWMHILYSSQVIKHKHGQTKGVRTHGELLHSHGDRLVHFYRKHEWWPPLILITAWAGIENIRRARTEEQSNRQKMELFFYIYLIFRWWLKQNNINIYLISKFSLYCHCIQPFGAAYNAFIHYLSIFFFFFFASVVRYGFGCVCECARLNAFGV